MQAAKDKLVALILLQEHYTNNRGKHVDSKVGDLVLLKAEGTSSTKNEVLANYWQPKFMGPFSVREVMGAVTYTI